MVVYECYHCEAAISGLAPSGRVLATCKTEVNNLLITVTVADVLGLALVFFGEQPGAPAPFRPLPRP